jgi:putative ABC transport system substrate-binding protein
MRRRDFIAGLGSAAAWPVVAGAQQGDRVRRIGFLMNLAADDAVMPTRLATFEHSLQELARIMHDSASFHVDAASPRTVDRSRWIGVI